MGLKTSASSFQSLINLVMSGYHYQILIAYLDDLLIFSPTIDTHIDNLRDVLGRLDKANLRLNLLKCSFLKKTITFLGHKISHNTIQPDPANLQVIKELSPPTSQKMVRGFLGLVGFYKKFIKNYGDKCAPLTKLLRKNVRFIFLEECLNTWQDLRNILISDPILTMPDYELTFYLTCDSSSESIASILSQIHDGVEKVIAYYGKVLSKADGLYASTELEALSVIDSIRHFHIYLSPKLFVVYTDHNALTYLFTTKNLTGRPARWSLVSIEFSINPAGIHRYSAGILWVYLTLSTKPSV